jgi:hypothetical protein
MKRAAQRPASAAARREPRCKRRCRWVQCWNGKSPRQGGRLHPASTASRASPPNELPPESCQSVGVHYHALLGRSLSVLNRDSLPYRKCVLTTSFTVTRPTAATAQFQYLIVGPKHQLEPRNALHPGLRAREKQQVFTHLFELNLSRIVEQVFCTVVKIEIRERSIVSQLTTSKRFPPDCYQLI